MVNTRILAAIETTKTVIPGYFESTLRQRAGAEEGACGSIVEGVTINQLEEILKSADWEEYSHDAVMKGCTAFKAEIPGLMGIVDLRSLEPLAMVTLDDRKNTGKVSATVQGVRGEKVGHTVLIVGDHEGHEVVFTFHPGDPVNPSSIDAKGCHGTRIFAADAIDIGLQTAKVV